mmetsp:Transcript_69307/g.149528  ORF Transcript_69307/g.149528 Transcript_69307/m.149528 type:complete len:116 (+) Transcript_69307:810-1157(+)
MLSGVGPAEHLETLGIEINHHNAEVGQNLQDHPFMPISRSLKSPLSLDALNHFPQNMQKLAQWWERRDNELSVMAEMTGYFKSDVALRKQEAAPDIQIAFIKSTFQNHGRDSSSN